MITIKTFVFGPFQENTYVLYDESNECIIIDPGCYDNNERQQLADFIKDKHLKPVKLLNTHCHLDHIFGNGFVAGKYNIKPEYNKNEQGVFDAYLSSAHIYNLEAEPSPTAETYLGENDSITFGKSKVEIFHLPGHSAGSLAFFNTDQKFVMVGDVLFFGSIGRTDLPGGNYETLINSIKNKLFLLGDDFIVYSGHGRSTTIGFEKKNNPFLT